MSAKRGRPPTDYHLHVTRLDDGFAWEIRYDRFARPTEIYGTQDEAQRAGERALKTLRTGRGSSDS